ncbi:MAG: hypothetical protein AAB790_02440 [Patescibacteria group bacterium]
MHLIVPTKNRVQRAPVKNSIVNRMVANGVQSRLTIGNPFEHNAILAVNRKPKESSVLPVQFVYLESLMVVPIPEQFYPLECGLL